MLELSSKTIDALKSFLTMTDYKTDYSMCKSFYSIIAILAVWLTALSTAAPRACADNAGDATVKRMVSALKSHKSIEAVFTIRQNNTSSTGSVTMAGKNFHLSTPQMKVWFDGRTQWAYAPSAGEVNITEPTADELAQINPLVIISSLSGSFKAQSMKAPSGTEKVKLTPRGKTDIAEVIITVNKTTSLPSSLTIKDRNGHMASIKISSIKPQTKVPSAAAFRFPAKQYPKVEVVDLR